MKKLLALALLSNGAFAAMSGNLAVKSNEIYRGLTLSNGATSVYGDLTYATSFGLFAGVATKTLQAGSAHQELDYTLGYTRELLKDLTMSLSANHYTYFAVGNKQNELILSGSYKFVTLSVGHLLDISKTDKRSQTYYNMALSQDLSSLCDDFKSWSAELAVGKLVTEKHIGVENYVDYRASLVKGLENGYKVSFSWTNTDRKLGDQTLTAILSKSF